MADTEMKWYVMRAVSGKESKVKEYIDAEIKKGDFGKFVSQVLIPTEKVVQVRNGKRIVKERTWVYLDNIYLVMVCNILNVYKTLCVKCDSKLL